MMRSILLCLSVAVLSGVPAHAQPVLDEPVRARDIGVAPGILSPGPFNAITDVDGVLVGHETLSIGTRVNTGATVIKPHSGNLYQEKVPAGFSVLNGYGKFAGSTQLLELGEIETPIVLTNTLSVAAAIEATLEWTLRQAENASVFSVNAIVGETNDGFLNDIRARDLKPFHILRAFDKAQTGPVPEGSVGAGRGTRLFGWKGGIGTSSRVLPDTLGGYTVGVLVQANYGGVLEVMGAPVGQELDQFYLKDELDAGDANGSIIIVVATDAPLTSRLLNRLARRSLLAIGRTGSPATNGSGDYAIAFSTAPSARVKARASTEPLEMTYKTLDNSDMSPLFQATLEASEEAIYNALFMAEPVDGPNGRVERISIPKVVEILDRHRLRDPEVTTDSGDKP